MSGSSLDYVYQKVDEAREQIEGFTTTSSCKYPATWKAFTEHLKLVSAALHDIEWVCSCDYAPGKEIEAVQKVVNKENEIEASIDMLNKAIAEALRVRNLK